jgi:hypothetical protein
VKITTHRCLKTIYRITGYLPSSLFCLHGLTPSFKENFAFMYACVYLHLCFCVCVSPYSYDLPDVSVEGISSNSGGPGFKSLCRRSSVLAQEFSGFTRSLQTSSRIRPIPFAFFPVQSSLIIEYFDAMHIQYEVLTASFNKSLHYIGDE